jgi:hypothetical protein
MRENKLSLVKDTEINDQMTLYTLKLIQIFSNIQCKGNFSKTLCTFVDKTDFFVILCKNITN